MAFYQYGLDYLGGLSLCRTLDFFNLVPRGSAFATPINKP